MDSRGFPSLLGLPELASSARTLSTLHNTAKESGLNSTSERQEPETGVILGSTSVCALPGVLQESVGLRLDLRAGSA